MYVTSIVSILSKVAYTSPLGPKDPNQDYLVCCLHKFSGS